VFLLQERFQFSASYVRPVNAFLRINYSPERKDLSLQAWPPFLRVPHPDDDVRRDDVAGARAHSTYPWRASNRGFFSGAQNWNWWRTPRGQSTESDVICGLNEHGGAVRGYLLDVAYAQRLLLSVVKFIKDLPRASTSFSSSLSSGDSTTPSARQWHQGPTDTTVSKRRPLADISLPHFPLVARRQSDSEQPVWLKQIAAALQQISLPS
jgi:hypothetical protein